jgi:hypothetical protein
MMSETENRDEPEELKAVGAVYLALKPLDAAIQLRVLRYAAEMLGIDVPASLAKGQSSGAHEEAPDDSVPPASAPVLPEKPAADEIEGISPVASKWIKRSGLDSKSLQKLFSLGIDEIDLIAQAIPGSNKKERMRNVLLLKGVAAYLGSGVPRVNYEQLKEACLHYKAYDGTNFAAYLKSFASEVTGSKEVGFTLTARGLTAATELVKKMLSTKE